MPRRSPRSTSTSIRCSSRPTSTWAIPDGYFNDRLVEVIDHLLATPEVAGPIKLTQPGVFYQYADPSIEERSAGQKAMIRLGSQNAAIVKEKLRALRKEVVKQSAGKQ